MFYIQSNRSRAHNFAQFCLFYDYQSIIPHDHYLPSCKMHEDMPAIPRRTPIPSWHSLCEVLDPYTKQGRYQHVKY